MNATQLDYAPVGDPAGMPFAISIFADRAHVRSQIADDVSGAGFRVLREAPVAELLEGEAVSLGEIVLLDCPRVDAATMAALSRLDMRIARSGARLVVSTTVEALEGVFACLDQSGPRILVAPTRGERVVALGQELTNIALVRVRENSGRDEISLLRLAEQVSEIARKLDAMVPSNDTGNASVFRFESPTPPYAGPEGEDSSGRLARSSKPPLPDPRLVRRIIRQRQARTKFFEGDLFADPAWDILLDLTAARAEHTRVSVTSLCIASGVPPTTALRWISQMTEMGLLQRIEDEQDKRRAFIALTDNAAEAMARYFAELDKEAGRLA
ncbi:winged helix DNA-binding protein [Parerythrobacter aestuarii]|uniref:winged helix DNA-binding protein n=1 Tax=Parerythrobacter aestuarii TaxID=3020909 RepID=UPI0024DE4EC4|nr:winged helix DNA-binding protein [Parerythrobacter aestuarii]